MERTSEEYLLVTKYSTYIYSTGKGKSTRDETDKHTHAISSVEQDGTN
jgi:hypothetical protein